MSIIALAGLGYFFFRRRQNQKKKPKQHTNYKIGKKVRIAEIVAEEGAYIKIV